MQLALFGATGTVGRHVVDQALTAGHHVCGLSRVAHPGLPSHERLRMIQGDVRDGDAVGRTIAGADVVLVMLGAGGVKGRLRAAGTGSIVATMEAQGVRRLVCQSTLGVGESWSNLNAFWKHVMFGALLRAVYRDHVAQEDIVRASDLDWTIVRPAAFSDGPARGRYAIDFGAQERDLALSIARADVAAFMMEAAANDQYLGRCVGLSDRKEPTDQRPETSLSESVGREAS